MKESKIKTELWILGLIICIICDMYILISIPAMPSWGPIVAMTVCTISLVYRVIDYIK